MAQGAYTLEGYCLGVLKSKLKVLAAFSSEASSLALKWLASLECLCVILSFLHVSRFSLLFRDVSYIGLKEL